MQSATYETDGISYEINVYEEQGGYRASWACPVCGRTDGLPYGNLSTAEAMGRAKAQLFG
jgi:hypothetical protein